MTGAANSARTRPTLPCHPRPTRPKHLNRSSRPPPATSPEDSPDSPVIPDADPGCGARLKYVDEPPGKQAGQRGWRWTAATTTVAVFLIHARRRVAGLTALLGEIITGIVSSDRYAV